MQKVEELKCLVRVTPIWISAIPYWVAVIQQQTFVVFQALQSDRRLGDKNFKIPAASYIVFTMIALTIWIPIYDRIIVPRLQNLTKKEGGITLLQKMGVGMILAVIAMIMSGIVENYRRNLALTRPIDIEPRRGAISSLSGLWLTPQLTLIGLSEAFTGVALVEFYYRQFPENMRSIGASLTFVNAAVSNYLSGFLISTIHRVTSGPSTGGWLPEDLNMGRLDYFYYLVAALGVLNMVYFTVCAKWYTYKGATTIRELV